ncbi:MAG: SPOR domain-containing protein [Rhodocyclales bacterium]|nr:SPOR domain-containing protein [Rhodocyclales bacterium]
MSKFDKTGKPAARSKPPRKSGGGTLLGIFIGLVIGILIAFGVVWYLNKSPLPFQNKYEGAPKTDKPAGGNGTATPAPLPGKPGDKPAERRFDFYNILEGKPPQGGMPPTGAPTPAAAPGATPPAGTAPAAGAVPAAGAPAVDTKPQLNDVFYLQVGSFQKAADADNLKAKLALTGLYASVQEVNIPDKGTMHRVRVGPFRDPDEMNRARALLAQNGVQASVVKQKE